MLPKITVVTPSYNQGEFLEQTILSVLGQRYPNLEYIIMDGGSSDNSVEVIQTYEKYLAHWESGEDGGQAAAINKGFKLATGDILCWLNSDDMFMPGIFFEIAAFFHRKTSPCVVFGECIRFDEENSHRVFGSNVVEHHASHRLSLFDYIHQPSCFWNRQAITEVGLLNEKLNFVFDWEWFIRARNLQVEFCAIGRHLSLYRLHNSHKTGSGGTRRLLEIEGIYKLYNSKEELTAWHRCLQIRDALKKRGLIGLMARAEKFIYYLLFQKVVSYQDYLSIKRMF